MSEDVQPQVITPVWLARLAVETFVTEKHIIPAPSELPPELRVRAGAFVSLKIRGTLRGCIGTIEPLHDTLAEEIIHNAIKSATEDPRFPPVRRAELPELSYSVDVLNPPELVQDVSCLDPKRYGVIVEWGRRRGLLLPDLEGVDSVEHQLAIACAKARIRPTDPYVIYRFEVKRYQ